MLKMSLQAHKIGKLEPQPTLKELLDLILPGHELSYVDWDSEIALIEGTEPSILVLCKTINKDVGVYQDSITNLSFGPEPIHKDTFAKIQLAMETQKSNQSIYVIHSTESQMYHFQCIIPYDQTYIKWRKNQ